MIARSGVYNCVMGIFMYCNGFNTMYLYWRIFANDAGSKMIVDLDNIASDYQHPLVRGHKIFFGKHCNWEKADSEITMRQMGLRKIRDFILVAVLACYHVQKYCAIC